MLAENSLLERLVEDISQMPDTKFAEVLDELKHCIRQPNPAPVGDFCLDLRNYRFDREEANAR
ncbi:MAG: hypothetical protein L3K52_09310 [Candidatus Thiothrix sulfatifontis]|nr:MAG: hypothetical protein L3K52_09310 [Candidatus Thiothrix sulfatifontis]